MNRFRAFPLPRPEPGRALAALGGFSPPAVRYSVLDMRFPPPAPISSYKKSVASASLRMRFRVSDDNLAS
jgi:hypothetical protein